MENVISIPSRANSLSLARLQHYLLCGVDFFCSSAGHAVTYSIKKRNINNKGQVGFVYPCTITAIIIQQVVYNICVILLFKALIFSDLELSLHFHFS